MNCAHLRKEDEAALALTLTTIIGNSAATIENEIHALQETRETIDVYEKEELIETIDPKERYLAEQMG